MSMDLKSSIFFYGIIIYLLSFIIEGPIRYVLQSAGGESLIYLRDIIMLFIILVYVLKVLISGKINKILMVTMFLLFFHAIVGFYYLGKSQVLFGLKLMVPLLMGMMAYPIFSSRPETIKKLYLIFYLIAVLGVFLNMFVTFPWEGMSYELLGHEIEGTRAWTALGFKRIAGFSRISFGVAAQTLILSIYLITHLERKWVTVPLWLLGGIAILATTSKSIMVAYGVISLFLIIRKIIPNYHDCYQKALIVPIMIMIALPLWALILNRQNGGVDIFRKPMFLSLLERMLNTWPDAFEILQKQGNVFLGRGIGAMGVSQVYFESQFYSPGDNLFVYALGFFGMMSIVYFLCIYKLAQKIDLKSDLFYYNFILFFIIYGTLINVIETNFMLLFLGIWLRYLWSKDHGIKGKVLINI